MTDVQIPPAFAKNADQSPEWARWLDQLPRLVQDMTASWELTLDGSAGHGAAALVIPVRTEAGDPAVLKIGWPHQEAEHEHLALRAWDGDATVRLLRAEPRRSVLLLEQAGTRDLNSIPVLEACEIIARFYPRLHRPAVPQLRRLSDLTRDWAEALAALPRDSLAPHRYREQAISVARDLAEDDDTDGVLVHTDLHYANVLESLRGDGSAWLVIDPKPLSGDPHFEIAPLLWNRWEELVETGDVRAAIRERFHAVVDTAGLDEDRARNWVIIRMMVNVLWSIGDRAPDAENRAWITNNITVAKAVQE